MRKESKKELLESYLEGRTDDKLTDVIQGWLCGELDEPGFDAGLEEQFGRMVVSGEPTRKTHLNYKKLHRRLGLGGRARVPLTKRLAFRVAAVLVPVLLIAGALFYIGRDTNEGDGSVQLAENPVIEGVTVTTQPGTHKNIELQDNSKVTVNGNTKIVYADDFKVRREVYLDGEAYFRIEKDPNIPFFVRTKYVTIEVTGTEFNVRAVGDEQRTTVSLTRGSVNIKAHDGEYTLEPGLEFGFDHENGESTIVPSSGAGWWMQPILFRDLTLVEIFGLMEDYYGVTISGKEGFADTLRYNVGFDRDDTVADVLGILSRYTRKFTFSVRGNSVVLTKTGPR